MKSQNCTKLRLKKKVIVRFTTGKALSYGSIRLADTFDTDNSTSVITVTHM